MRDVGEERRARVLDPVERVSEVILGERQVPNGSEVDETNISAQSLSGKRQ
jgi:hypothetical protein